MTVADSLTEFGFGLGWSTVKALPQPVADRLFAAAAERTWRGQGSSVLQLKANLSRVLADGRLSQLDEVTHEGVRRYLRYWCEVFRLPSWSPEQINARFTLGEGLERLDAAVASGGGAIMVSPHMGNWDLAAAWACQRYGGLVTVAERLKPEGLYDKFLAYRESLGMEVHPLGEPDIMRTLVRRLKEGKLVCLLADRDISHTGVPVEFFGERASMPAGPAVLSMLTGAPIMTVTDWHTETGLRGEVGEPLVASHEGGRDERIAAMTQAIADSFAVSIRQHPADWHMMQPLWAVDVDARA